VELRKLGAKAFLLFAMHFVKETPYKRERWGVCEQHLFTCSQLDATKIGLNLYTTHDSSQAIPIYCLWETHGTFVAGEHWCNSPLLKISPKGFSSLSM